MIKHLFKYIWTQRGKNVWILTELFLVFVILWYIIDTLVMLGITSMTPTGTNIDNVYKITYGYYNTEHPKQIVYDEDSEEPGRNFMRMLDRIRQHADVEIVSIGKNHYPYCRATMTNIYNRDSLSSNTQMLFVTPEYFRMFDVRPIDGGSPEVFANIIENDGIVVSAGMANDLFPDTQAVGESFYDNYLDKEYTINAVSHIIKRYEYTRPSAVIFLPLKDSDFLGNNEDYIWKNIDICIKVNSNVANFSSRFKEDMRQQLEIGNFFLSEITPLTSVRENFLKDYDVYSTIQSRIGLCIFFLINIFLCVLGTFWLRIKKRRSEIGLRIAMGSTGNQVRNLLLAESLLMLLFASVPAMIVCINLVIADIMPTDSMDFTTARFILDTIATYLLLAIIIAFSTLYPAIRSAKILPAEALHNE